MRTPIETFEMKTNFAGLIQLLAKNLYSQENVFVRELIQNGGDSITLRREVEPEHEGRIEIFTYARQNTIIFRDNGLGMDEQDIKRFLSVIGSTGTGTARDRLDLAGHDNARQLVGQFGIGMLSAFVVARKVVVRTRKLGSDRALAWHNDGSTECRLYEDDKAEVGTEVAVILEDSRTHLLEEDPLRRSVRRYCDFLRYPIYLNDEGPVNVMNAPWHQKHWAGEQEKSRAYTSFLNERFPDWAVRAIPVDIEQPVRVQGALYITEGKIPDLTSNGRVDLYVRRFLITEGDDEILPRWAPFIGGILDCPDLMPTAARDNIQRNDPKLAVLREELANLIVGFMSRLAHDEPEEFARINESHSYHLKGMALFHEEFFDLFGSQLLFDTNKGKMNLETYLAANPGGSAAGPSPLYHFSRPRDRSIYYEMADQAGIVVIDAKRTFEKELLEKFARSRPGRVTLEPVDVGMSPVLFRSPVVADRNLADRVELAMMQMLARKGFSHVDVQARCFRPATAPSMALATPQAVARNNLQTLMTQNWVLSSLGALTAEMQKALDSLPPVKVVVNLENELVRRVGGPEFADREIGEVLAALVLDNPAGGGDLLGEDTRVFAAECRQHLLHLALDNLAGGQRRAAAGGE